MTVMVDELQVWGHAKHRCFKDGSAHLTADTVEELHAFAERLGLRRAWFQPRSSPHYDLSPAKRAKALVLGAVFVSAREQARRRIAERASRAREEVIARRVNSDGMVGVFGVPHLPECERVAVHHARCTCGSIPQGSREERSREETLGKASA